MSDDNYTFAQARTRLEEIVSQVRKRDTSLETSLDLLEEGVRLAGVCTEASDHTEWRSVIEEQTAEVELPAGDGPADEAFEDSADVPAADDASGDEAEAAG